MSSKRANDTLKEFDLFCDKLNMSTEDHKKILDIVLILLKNITIDFSLTLLKMTCEELKKEQEEITKEKQNKVGIWADPNQDNNPGNVKDIIKQLDKSTGDNLANC